PARAVALVPNRHLIIDLAGSDLVGPIHQAAPVAREAEAVEPHHVDVAGAQRLAVLQDLAGFIDGGKEQAVQNFRVREAALRDAQLANHGLYDLIDLGIDNGGAIWLLVAIPACSRL